MSKDNIPESRENECVEYCGSTPDGQLRLLMNNAALTNAITEVIKE